MNDLVFYLYIVHQEPNKNFELIPKNKVSFTKDKYIIFGVWVEIIESSKKVGV